MWGFAPIAADTPPVTEHVAAAMKVTDQLRMKSAAFDGCGQW